MAGDLRPPVLIGQLTDTHVVAPDADIELYVDNNQRLRDAVASIENESPTLDALVITGDLVNDAARLEYATLLECLAPLTVPVLPLPGNHDDRSLLRDAFPDAGWVDADHLSWVHTIGGVRIIGLDSTCPGRHGGQFDAERREWLAGELAVDHDGPVLLALHHPPFQTGIEWMDRDGFDGLEQLVDLLSPSPVDRVLCGHVHRPVSSVVGGVVAQVAMSTVQHVALDLAEHSEPSLIRDPVGYQVHRVDGSNIVTHARYTSSGDQPFRPEWADEY